MDSKEAFDKIERKFTISNSIEVDRSIILRADWELAKQYMIEQASRQALEGEPVAYQYWWPESPRQVTVCKAKDLPSTHPDLIVVPLYTHLSGHCPSCGRSAVRKDCDEVLTPEIEEIREHCNRAMKMEKSNE